MYKNIINSILNADQMTPKQILDLQFRISDLIIIEEKFIQNFRKREKKFKYDKRVYTKKQSKQVQRINKYDILIENTKKRIKFREYKRNSLKFLGDCIAYSFYEEHDIRTFIMTP